MIHLRAPGATESPNEQADIPNCRSAPSLKLAAHEGAVLSHSCWSMWVDREAVRGSLS